MLKKVFVEGYGCSHNLSDTEKLKALLLENGFELANNEEKANLLIINACAVKKATENRMLNRIRKLFSLYNDSEKQLIVFGCFASISPDAVQKISEKIVLIKNLKELSEFFSLHTPCSDFSPNMPEIRSNEFISIMPIATGCLGACTFCCVSKARGKLKSFLVQELNEKFRQLIKETKEIRLCAEDTGCYGCDINSSLPELLKTLLKNKGNYRIRIGMMNPHWLKKYLPEMIEIFKQENVFKFLHLPLQSGSDNVLKKMNRFYSTEDFMKLINELRKEIPEITISTDIIVGFPGETENDFKKTLSVIKKLKPDIVNISRYNNRPGAVSNTFSEQLHGREKKKRSRILNDLCKKISLEKNKKLIGIMQEVLFNEIGKNNSLMGRTNYYKPVVVKNADKKILGEFRQVKIIGVKPTYVEGILVHCAVLKVSGLF